MGLQTFLLSKAPASFVFYALRQNQLYFCSHLVSDKQKSTSMSTYRAADSKREEFRKYLEKSGVVDALTKVLVNLYEEPEKPNNALDFLLKNMTLEGPETSDVEALKAEVMELKSQNSCLAQENEELRAKVDAFEGKKLTDENLTN